MAKKRKATGSIPSSASDILSSAISMSTKSRQLKSTLKTLIHTIPATSPLIPSLPSALSLSISESLDSLNSSHAASDPDVSIHLRRLRIYAFISHFCITHQHKCFSPFEIFPSVRLLHDGLLLYEEDSDLMSAVASLCEDWWKEDLPRREELIPLALPYLLSKSLTNGKKADVHRVFALREALCSFDFEDESIQDLKLLLIRCLVTPLYLKTEEGKLFIAFLLGLDEQLLREALALMKTQIAFDKKSVLDAYSAVLFRVWKGLDVDDAKGVVMREVIEDGFMQELIDWSVHERSTSLAMSIRRVLRGFLDQRSTNGVDKLLFRLAQPVLIRSLQVTNSNVRLNALHLLIDMFPLEDPDVTRDVKESLMLKQFFLIDKLLADDCPTIRAVSVEGTCRILNIFWEIIPPPTITKMLTTIFKDISCDSSSPVRLSVVNGLIFLLGNPHTHEILKRLLPRLGFLFFDCVLSVRIAFVELLLTVKDLRGFQYNKIVGLDDLLSSLADEHPSVARKITRLLMSTYFPSQKMISEACNRCIVLIKRSPVAGARFCEFALLEGSSIKSLTELFDTIINILISAKNLSSEQVDGLFAACANICTTLCSESSSKRTSVELIFKGKYKHLLSVAASVRSQTSLLIMASVVSPKTVTEFREHCCINLTLKCRGLSESQDLQAEIRTVHKLVFSCGWLSDFIGPITSILETAAYKFQANSSLFTSRKKTINKSKLQNKCPNKLGTAATGEVDGSLISDVSTFEDDYSLVSAISWQLNDLLISEDTTRRNAILNSISLPMFSALRISSELCIAQHLNALDISPILAYCSISLHMFLHIVEIADLEENTDVAFRHELPFDKVILSSTLSHLIECVTKVFVEKDSAVGRNPGSNVNQTEKSGQRQRSKRNRQVAEKSIAGISNTAETNDFLKITSHFLKIVAVVLKFMIEAITTAGFSELSYLQFAAACTHSVVSALKENQNNKFTFNEESSIIIKSFFTYASKLLHLFLSSVDNSSPVPPEVSCLANSLFDLIASFDVYTIKSKHALLTPFIAKEWLPVLVLGVCAENLTNHRQHNQQPTFSNHPLWLTMLSKVGFHEATSDDDSHSCSTAVAELEATLLKTIMTMVITLLNRGNQEILDAVIMFFVSHLKLGLERNDCNFVLGLVHFMCVKLLGNSRKVESVNEAFKDLCLIIETIICGRGNDDDDDDRRRVYKYFEMSNDILKHAITSNDFS